MRLWAVITLQTQWSVKLGHEIKIRLLQLVVRVLLYAHRAVLRGSLFGFEYEYLRSIDAFVGNNKLII